MCVTSLFLEMISHYLFQCFRTVPSYCLHYRRFFLYGFWSVHSMRMCFMVYWSGMHNILVVVFLRVHKSVLSLYDLSEVWTMSFPLFGFFKLCFHSPNAGLICNNLSFSLLFQCCCLCCCMYLFILKSVWGILNFFSVVRFMTDPVALSTWSFPLIPVWLEFQNYDTQILGVSFTLSNLCMTWW